MIEFFDSHHESVYFFFGTHSRGSGALPVLPSNMYINRATSTSE